MSFLAKYKAEDTERDPFSLTICQVSPTEPEFVIKIYPLTLKEQRKIYERASFAVGGNRGPDRSLEKANRKFVDKVVTGWDGLSAANFNWLCRRSGVKLEDGQTVDFTPDAAWFIYENALNADFAQKITDALEDWQDGSGEGND